MAELVSVVIPAYRAEKTIRRAVESVLHQTHQAREIIVVDDGSPVPLAGSLEGLGPQVSVIRQANGGASSARNAGIEVSKGDFVAFLDADDYWEPSKLATQLNLHRRYPELGLTFGAYWERRPEEPETARRIRTPELDQAALVPFRVQDPQAFLVATKVWTGSVMVARKTLGDDRFTLKYKTAEDRDLWHRLIKKAPIAYLEAPLATAVLLPNSLSRGDADMDYANMLQLVRDNAGNLGAEVTRQWEAKVFRSWAGACLGTGAPEKAIRPAFRRWRIEPFSREANWILISSFLRVVLRSVGRVRS